MQLRLEYFFYREFRQVNGHHVPKESVRYFVVVLGFVKFLHVLASVSRSATSFVDCSLAVASSVALGNFEGVRIIRTAHEGAEIVHRERVNALWL